MGHTLTIEPAVVRRAIARRSFCTLATSSARNRPLVAGVLYAEVDGELYLNTSENSAKARNIRANDRVAVCIPVRRIPFGPPFAVHFQATAELLRPDDPHIRELADAGRLRRITSHGELDEPDSCFVRVRPTGSAVTYGLGVPLWTLLRDPIRGVRRTELR